MTRSTQKKNTCRADTPSIEFQLPPSIEPPALSGEAARVVREFVGTLDAESSALAFALEVSGERIEIHRRAGRTPAPGAIMVSLDGALGVDKERSLSVALSRESVRRDLRTIVDAARGNEEITIEDINFAIGHVSVAVGSVVFQGNWLKVPH